MNTEKNKMEKCEYTGDLLLYPCPTVLVTSKKDDVEDVFTVSWSGIASSHPEYVTIAINTKRYSYCIIKDSKKFCVNIPDIAELKNVDYCGTVSGRDSDKFRDCRFDKEYFESDYILIRQCKFHLICEVEHIIELGSHDLFIAKVIQKLIDSSVTLIHEELDPIIYFRPNYYGLRKEVLGHYGYIKERTP